jgi:hypothetical protein
MRDLDLENEQDICLGTDEDDGDFQYHSDGDMEHYEYSEEDDQMAISSTDGKEHGENRKHDENDPSENDFFHLLEARKHFIPYEQGSSMSKILEDGLAQIQAEPDQNWDYFENVKTRFEHLAGPGCTFTRGYPGFNISAEEMRGCNTVQCLVLKMGDWESSRTDRDFEVTSDYFLSGLSGYLNSRDMFGSDHIPERHGVSELNPDTQFLTDFPNNFTYPMPFHPTCFEVYTRVSRFHFGVININDLGEWRFKADIHWNNECLNRDPAVCRGLDQRWQHVPGDEWITANPILIPSLPGVLQSCVLKDGIVDSQSSPFLPRKTGSSYTNPTDPFIALPREVLHMILEPLSSQDIADLRLTSRAFTHLPIYIFANLLKKEMPWLWEAWDQDTPTSPWAIESWCSLKQEFDRVEKIADELRYQQVLQRVVITEEIPDIWKDWRADRPWLSQNLVPVVQEYLDVWISKMTDSALICKLPKGKTNWYEVYAQIKRHWDSLKGLRNRARIWRDCEQIVEQIKRMKEDGKI